MRDWVGRLGLVGLSGIATLALLEGGIRAFNLVSVSEYRPIFDPSLPYQMRPMSSMTEVEPEFTAPVSINSAGFRDREFSIEKQPGVARIAVLGDSFAFGTGVWQGERATEQLASLLTRTGRRVEVYNFGIPDTETPAQLEVLTRKALPYKPDLVLLFFYIGNDIVDNAKLASGREKGYDHAGSTVYALVDAVRTHSRLYQFMMMRAVAVPGLRNWYNEIKTKYGWGEVGEQSDLFLVSNANDPMLWGATFAALERLVEAVRASRAELIVVLVPAKLQYDDALWGQFLRQQARPAAAYRQTRVNEALRQFLKRSLKVAVLDPTEDFRIAVREGRTVYYPVNGHLTPEGHAVLARHIADHLP